MAVILKVKRICSKRSMKPRRKKAEKFFFPRSTKTRVKEDKRNESERDKTLDWRVSSECQVGDSRTSFFPPFLNNSFSPLSWLECMECCLCADPRRLGIRLQSRLHLPHFLSSSVVVVAAVSLPLNLSLCSSGCWQLRNDRARRVGRGSLPAH